MTVQTGPDHGTVLRSGLKIWDRTAYKSVQSGPVSPFNIARDQHNYRLAQINSETIHESMIVKHFHRNCGFTPVLIQASHYVGGSLSRRLPVYIY
jgi:hypothetical protein